MSVSLDFMHCRVFSCTNDNQAKLLLVSNDYHQNGKGIDPLKMAEKV